MGIFLNMIIKMIKTETKTQEIKTKTYYCDFCGVHITSIKHKCVMCGKDLCQKCVGYMDDTIGDYADYYCKSCWAKGEYYRAEIKKHEDSIDKLNEEWENKCSTNYEC